MQNHYYVVKDEKNHNNASREGSTFYLVIELRTNRYFGTIVPIYDFNLLNLIAYRIINYTTLTSCYLKNIPICKTD